MGDVKKSPATWAPHVLPLQLITSVIGPTGHPAANRARNRGGPLGAPLGPLGAPGGPRRHSRGILDPMGSETDEYRPERSYMDLIRTKIHDFDQNLAC